MKWFDRMIQLIQNKPEYDIPFESIESIVAKVVSIRSEVKPMIQYERNQSNERNQ